MPTYRNMHNGTLQTVEGVEANVLEAATNWERVEEEKPPEPKAAPASAPRKTAPRKKT